ncbi:MAG TPA: formate dehydrogenase accessory sulfurtransferase FdhD [Anaeromyxobacter sp.]|nr:formate dehydrogenase accessory sulfurtransferase FdhD [Anaeromyxobacter sp.]
MEPGSRGGAEADPRAVAMRSVVRRGTETVDALAVEEPLEIRVDGEAIATTMRTPGRDADLALGFLFSEGIVRGAADVSSIAHCGRAGEEGYGNVLDVRSAAGIHLDPDRVLEGRRFVPTTSACGVCGRRAIDGLLARIVPLERGPAFAPSLVHAAMEALHGVQPAFASTGGLHAAVAIAADGAVLAAAEDVGRHNAVDKVVGALVRVGRVGAGAPPEAGPVALAVSGRSGFEIVQKAAAARIPLVASVSAPSSLAVDLAERAGLTLAGFVRSGSMNLYSHAWRLRPGP